MKPKPLVRDHPVVYYKFKGSDWETEPQSKKAPTLGVVAICRIEQRDLGGFLEHPPSMGR